MAPVFGGLLLLSVLGVSWAQRQVIIQQGPLYRTVGSHITLWCKVRGYQGPSEQNFLYSIYLPSAPDREVQVVATGDPAFSYAIYSQRVRSGDISVERVSGDHTLLHIRQLEERDAGEYECHTPNTDPTYHGSYSAKMNLNVLPDTLKVTMVHQTLEKMEGASLELTCQVSKASTQHTHVSVTWLLTTDQDSEILSLSRDFVLLPGAGYLERFTSGDIRMDKLGDATYTLTIRALRLSDQGEIYCQGSEWIQDPDGTWTKITEKQSEKVSVRVSAVGGGGFDVGIRATGGTLSAGSPLEVTCSVTHLSPDPRRFHVSWLLNNEVAASWEPSGITQYMKLYSARAARWQLSVGRRDQHTWTLRINWAHAEDGGSYMCVVTEEGSDRKQNSNLLSVTVEPTGNRGRRVILSTDVSAVYEGKSVKYQCAVPGPPVAMSVGWYRMGSAAQPVEVASLQADGELRVGEDYVQRYQRGHLAAQKVTPGLYVLRLDRVTQSDGGEFICSVTERIQEREDVWENVTTESNVIHITVTPLDGSFSATLMTRNARVTSGDNATLFCRVTAQYSLLDKFLLWSWDFQPSSNPQGPFQSVVATSRSDLSWGNSSSGFRGKAQLSVEGHTATLTIFRVQQEQGGSYVCRVGVLDPDVNTRTPSVPSNVMAVSVQLPPSRLLMDTTARLLSVTSVQDEAAVTCDIKARTPGTALSVAWHFLPPTATSPVEILAFSQEGVISPNPSFSGPRSRFLSERVSADVVTLRILRPGSGQMGSYYCSVQEWLQKESGAWTRLGKEKTSGATHTAFSASDTTLNVPKENVSSEVPEGGDVVLTCPLGVALSSASLHSVSWYYQRPGLYSSTLLYRADREGVTEYEESLAKRLQFVATSRGNYSLILRNVGQEEAGTYYCQAEEWRLQEERWKMEATDTSGYLQLRITRLGDHLSVNHTNVTLLVPEKSILTLPCQVLSVSTPSSALSVTWWRILGPGTPEQLLFNASHTGLYHYPSDDGIGSRLQYERASEGTGTLRILSIQEEDAGVYYCWVQEWVLIPRGAWSLMGEHRSGDATITVQPEGVHSQVCSSPLLFSFLAVFPFLFILLVILLAWRYLKRRKNKTGNSNPKSRGHLLSPVTVCERNGGGGTEEAE
ncbi:immunoglobulin superfamily member 3-like [Pseudophryne corroboree]|uniref:immunoglobulin superfamily member 3-like n=1 Tax=Pseudophryne corroboree TaxID=495146 RepID=UPI0030815ADA